MMRTTLIAAALCASGSVFAAETAPDCAAIADPAARLACYDDKHGKAKYTGMHAFRHFYASWCINRRADGGLELPIKLVQGRLGHASIQMTADRYGHLFPRGDDGTEMAAAEQALLG